MVPELEKTNSLGADNFFERRLGHALFPGRIAQLEPVPAGIVKIKLPSREITFRAVMKFDDGNFLFVKNLAGLHERFRAHRERMMHSLIYAGRFVHGYLALAQQDPETPPAFVETLAGLEARAQAAL